MNNLIIFFSRFKKYIKFFISIKYIYRNNSIFNTFDIEAIEYETKNNLIIAIGFNPWKRDFFREYFPNHCIAFTRGKTPALKIISALKNLDKNYEVCIWSYKEHKLVYKYLKKNNIKISRVEDGFIRSIGLGSSKTKPLSLAIDDDSIYFNPSTESKLEKIIFKKANSYSESQLNIAKNLMSKIIDNNISKYNKVYKSNDESTLEIDNSKKTILVIGQVEKDMSIKLGCSTNMDNLKLLQLAKKENPNNNIIFKGHPDVTEGFQKHISDENEYSTFSVVAPSNIPLSHLINISDHIYTITSLSGFEALIRGKKVTCVGAPFYSNWGLTDDRQTVDRRNNYNLTIEQLFYASYIDYPTYLNNSLELTLESIISEISYIIVIQNFISKNEFNQALLYFKNKILRNNNIVLDESLNILDFIIQSSIRYGKSLESSEVFTIMLQKSQDTKEEKYIIQLFNLAYINRNYDFIYDNLNLLLYSRLNLQLKFLTVLSSKPKRPDTNFSKRYDLICKIQNIISSQVEDKFDKKLISEYVYLSTKFKIYIFNKDSNNILKLYKLLEKYNKVEILHLLMKYLYKDSNMEYSKIKTYLSNFGGSKKTDTYKFEAIRFMVKEKKYEHALSSLHSIKSNSFRKLRLYEEIYTNTYQYENLIKTYKDILKQSTNFNNIYKEEEKLKNTIFLKESSEILNHYPQPHYPTGLWIYTNYSEYEAIAMTIPIAIEAKKLNFAIISIGEGTLNIKHTNDQDINFLNGLISKDRESLNNELRVYNNLSLRNDWKIDWDKKCVETDGINYFQGIYEQLSMQLRRATIDIKDFTTLQMFSKYLKDCDAAHTACLHIEKVAISKKIPIRLISATAHGAPYSVYRRFAAKRGYKNNIHFMAVNIAYETYYNNIGSKTASTIAFEDVTYYHDTLRQPLLASKDNFFTWYNENKDNKLIANKVESYLNMNRVVNKIDCSTYLDRIKTYKQNKKKIFCLFGKVLADLAVPFDGGPAHENMVDFIKHTIEIFIEYNKEDLLIIKPHPHELRSEIAKDLTERLSDFLPKELPANILYLDNNAFSLHELIDNIDVGLLWNGTACMELGAKNKKVIMCSYFGKYDYPINFEYPKDRKNYEHLLTNISSIRISKDVELKSKMLLYYMQTDEIAIPFNYSHRRSTNDPIGGVHWKKDEIEKYFNTGDVYMKKCAQKLLKSYPDINPNL